MGPTIARHAATQDGLVTTPSPRSASPLNTQTVSSPSRTNPPKTQTAPDPIRTNPRKTRTLPYLSFLSAAKNLPRLSRPPGNQPRKSTPARPQTTRRPMARANAETPATSEYRSATCCQCQPAPCDRATTRDRAPRSRSGTHTLPPSCRRRPVPRGAAGPRPNPAPR